MIGQTSPSGRIIFMGTPEFAVASLEALIKNQINVVAVVTAHDKPAGRGMKLRASEVKSFAEKNRIPVLQPLKLKDPFFIEQLKSFRPDLQVVVAFRMLPEIVWNLPPLGTINLHASFLPQYRGAAPINWAVINGEKETGITTFKLKQEIDTGDILLQEKVTIGDEESAGELHDRMKLLGGDLLAKTILGLLSDTLQPMSQDKLITQITPLQPAPKIFTETCRIDWTKPLDQVYNLIRGLSPYPGAFTSFNNKMLKIYKGKLEPGNVSLIPGHFTTDYKHFMKFACSDGFLSITELQMEGKKKMNIEEFLRGFRI